MAASGPSVDPGSLGTWLIKASRGTPLVDDALNGRVETVQTWCVRRTYRTALIEAGQPVLLWISGQDRTFPAGIYAQGHTTGAATLADAEDRGSAGVEARLVMPVELMPVAPPVRRSELLLHPVLAGIEVVTMPAGSNPSFLRKTQLQALRQGWPQVTVA